MFETNADIKALTEICDRIGYGNACNIICKAWDDKLYNEYGLPPYHFNNWNQPKRAEIVAQEETLRQIKEQQREQ